MRAHVHKANCKNADNQWQKKNFKKTINSLLTEKIKGLEYVSLSGLRNSKKTAELIWSNMNLLDNLKKLKKLFKKLLTAFIQKSILVKHAKFETASHRRAKRVLLIFEN